MVLVHSRKYVYIIKSNIIKELQAYANNLTSDPTGITDVLTRALIELVIHKENINIILQNKIDSIYVHEDDDKLTSVFDFKKYTVKHSTKPYCKYIAIYDDNNRSDLAKNATRNSRGLESLYEYMEGIHKLPINYTDTYNTVHTNFISNLPGQLNMNNYKNNIETVFTQVKSMYDNIDVNFHTSYDDSDIKKIIDKFATRNRKFIYDNELEITDTDTNADYIDFSKYLSMNFDKNMSIQSDQYPPFFTYDDNLTNLNAAVFLIYSNETLRGRICAAYLTQIYNNNDKDLFVKFVMAFTVYYCEQNIRTWIKKVVDTLVRNMTTLSAHNMVKQAVNSFMMDRRFKADKFRYLYSKYLQELNRVSVPVGNGNTKNDIVEVFKIDDNSNDDHINGAAKK